MWLYRRSKPTWDVGKTGEKLVNYEPAESDLQASGPFSQHPKWFYYTGNLNN